MSNHLVINGIPKNIDTNQSLRDLLTYLRKNLCNDAAVISCIRIDGRELTEMEEEKLQAETLDHLGDIEVFTAHPHELAQETLQSLLPFTLALDALSKGIAEQIRNPRMGVNLDVQYQRLLGGLDDFIEAIKGTKQIMRLYSDSRIALLEADLASVLTDILEARKNRNVPYLADLLGEHLPFSLQEWRENGIPTLMRARDS
jgi:hypothetical protein